MKHHETSLISHPINLIPPTPQKKSQKSLQLFHKALEVLALRRALLHPGGRNATPAPAEPLRVASGAGRELHIAADVVLGHPWKVQGMIGVTMKKWGKIRI